MALDRELDQRIGLLRDQILPEIKPPGTPRCVAREILLLGLRTTRIDWASQRVVHALVDELIPQVAR